MSYDGTKRFMLAAPKKGTSVNVRALPGLTAPVMRQVVSPDFIGRLSGTFFRMKDGNWYEVTMYVGAYSESHKMVKMTGYVREDVCIFAKVPGSANEAKSKEEEQSALNQCVGEMKKTVALLESIHERINQLPAGHPEKAKLRERWNQRKTFYDSIIANFQKNNGKELKCSFFDKPLSAVGNNGVGIAPVVLIVIGAALIIGSATIVYYVMKSSYESATISLQSTAELDEALKLLDAAHPGEGLSDKVKENLDGQIKDAYAKGKADEKNNSSIWPWVIGGGLITALLMSRGKGGVVDAATARLANKINPA